MAAPSITKKEMADEIGPFLDSLYREKEGYVYSPTLDRKLSKEEGWNTHYFKWPEQRENIIEHVQKNTGTIEVYIGPALYKSNSGTALKENVLGSHVVWAEFDGVAPKYNETIPEPGQWLSSSTGENHVHVYWPLKEFCNDANTVEDINRALTYNLGADSGGWDITQVLRVPLSVNHKRKQFTSKVTYSQSYVPLSVEAFGNVKPPKHKAARDFDIEKVPGNINELVWSKLLGEGGRKLFFKTKEEVTDRSSSLMALAYFMAERTAPRLSDEEMFAVLYHADSKWEKFTERKDRNKRLFDIVIKAREKYPYDNPINDFEFMSFDNFMANQVDVDWAVEGLLERSGILFLSAQPGVGKTQMSLLAALHMACGKDWLGWSFERPQKILFLSMEMGQVEVQIFMNKMVKIFTEEEMALIKENFLMNPLGYGVPLDNEEGQDKVEFHIEHHQPDGIFLDSLGTATGDELTSEATIKKTFGFVKRCAQQYNTFFWFIHHQRKAQMGNSKPNKLADLYGSTYIGAYGSVVICLWPTSNGIEVSSLKVRLAKQFTKFIVHRDEDTLNLVLPDMNQVASNFSGGEASVDPDPGTAQLDFG